MTGRNDDTSEANAPLGVVEDALDKSSVTDSLDPVLCGEAGEDICSKWVRASALRREAVSDVEEAVLQASTHESKGEVEVLLVMMDEMG